MTPLKDVATGFLAITGQNEPGEAEWESEYRLLRTTASLMETTPHALLHKISARTGDSLSLRNLQNGQRLPIMSKAELLRTLEERICQIALYRLKMIALNLFHCPIPVDRRNVSAAVGHPILGDEDHLTLSYFQ